MNKSSKLKETRQEILKINDCFSSFIVEVQKVKYNDVIKEFEAKKDKYQSKAEYHWVSSSLLISSKQNTGEYLLDISLLLKYLSKKMGKLLILGDWDSTWLNEANRYPLYVKATDYLIQHIDKNYRGGFILSQEVIETFIPNLFWVIRCDASLPEIFISFEFSKTIISICKHGVLHIENYDEKERIEIEDIISNFKFLKVKNCSDPIIFDNFEGRKLYT